MSFFRSYLLPFLIVLTFLIAMLAVSARIFLPNDMAAPAPIEAPTDQLTEGALATRLWTETPLQASQLLAASLKFMS
ncbi:MAG: hypothetical protein AAF609_05890 [Cyanobacteria bacterium P01_C01_bin.120]